MAFAGGNRQRQNVWSPFDLSLLLEAHCAAKSVADASGRPVQQQPVDSDSEVGLSGELEVFADLAITARIFARRKCTERSDSAPDLRPVRNLRFGRAWQLMRGGGCGIIFAFCRGGGDLEPRRRESGN